MEKNTNNTHLLKMGDTIVFSKTGVDYELEAGKVYVPKVDCYTDEITLNFGSEFSLPTKLYTPKNDEKFIKKILTSYNAQDKTMGVLLSGTKGTGKTVLAKRIAKEANMPILTMDNTFHPSDIRKLFNKLENIPVCVIFDEFDKMGEKYDSDSILRVLDGISSAGKHLILFTCNNVDMVNEYMLDRCGRIRYYREFEEMGPSMISEILTDRLDDKSEVEPLTDFIMANFGLLSFDNIASFADEVNLFPNDTFEELFSDMNISEK